jgi:hypothetical protein
MGLPRVSNSVSSYWMPGSLKMRSMITLVVLVVIVSAPKGCSVFVSLKRFLSKNLIRKIAALIPHAAQQLLDLLHG